MNGPGKPDPGDQFVTFPVLRNYSSIPNPLDRWRAYHLTDYVIEQVSAGGWVPSDTVRIYVLAGLKALVVRESDKDTMPRNYPFYMTADDLFSRVEGVGSRLLPGDSLFVEYDSRFGYPSKISFFTSRITDADMSIYTWNIRQIVNPYTPAPNAQGE